MPHARRLDCLGKRRALYTNSPPAAQAKRASQLNFAGEPTARPTQPPYSAQPLPFSQPPFAGKPPALAESLVRSKWPFPILALGREDSPSEASMATQQISSKGLRPVLGAVLLALGLAILFGNLEAIDGPLGRISGVSESIAPGMMLSLVLTIFHTLQSYAFDHQRFLSGLQQILVSFWPLGLVILGTVLLRDAFLVHFARTHSGTSSTGTGNRS
jgi:hypothetical protein